ncbi:MAG: dTDP-4-amino-4,6-dideoxygalactose transaminase [Kiritimatiellae bacterium]|nr:dTDP-4-amino-4,6-dideoxygalactose transaminase [Kiritimatiellia bacterium]
MIHFNRPYLTGRETDYIRQAVEDGKISGNGEFTHRCQEFFERRYGIRKCLLTTSCTDALEMAAILSGVGPGDEVIVPSYTFVSSALAFVRQGARVVFADSRADEPNIDAAQIEALVTPRTKAIVPVHYAGCACDMDAIMSVAERHGLVVVEDAAQAVESSYRGRPLGSIGHLACFSFHETKNVISGEGGMLAVNDERFARRAEIIWEKGTNRAEFFRGEVNKYGWVDVGSSFLPSEVVSAFLWAQLEHIDEIQAARRRIWERYYDFFSGLAPSRTSPALPKVPDGATNNAHMFYLLFPDLAARTGFIAEMRARDVLCVFHYLPLHSSPFYRARHDGRELPNCDRYADTLVRLPLYCGLGGDQDKVLAAAEEALSRLDRGGAEPVGGSV